MSVFDWLPDAQRSQTRGNTYRCGVCDGGIVMHDEYGGPYGCHRTREMVRRSLGLTDEQAARGWDNGTSS